MDPSDFKINIGLSWVIIRVMHLGFVDRPFVPLIGIVPSFISRGTPHHAAREASISEGKKLNIWILPEAGFFYMPQSWDMGQIIWLPLWRKASEKSDGFGRVWTRELGNQRPAC
jgi:hypothetical protein